MAGKNQTNSSSNFSPESSGAEESRSPAEMLDPTERGATASLGPDIKPETEEKALCRDDEEPPPFKRTTSQSKGSFTIILPDSLFEESFDDNETLSDVLNKNLTLKKLRSNRKKNQLLITGQKFLTGIVPLHLPCSFITNHESFKIEFIAGEEESSYGKDLNPNTLRREKHIVFYIDPKGSGNRIIVKNKHISQQGVTLCIYAFKGETVLEALERDGRFKDVVFKKVCEVDTKKMFEMHVSVDGLNNRKFTLIVSNKDAPVSQQMLIKTVPINKATADHQAPSVATGEPQSTSTTAGDLQPPTSGNGDSQSARTGRGTGQFYPLPDTKEVYSILKSQMDGLIKLMKERKKETKDKQPIKELLRQEFGKNTEIFTAIDTIRRQTELSESVCFITVPATDGKDCQGTGFRFIGNCILTCAHILSECRENSQYQPELITKVSVTFKYEKPSQKSECVFPVKQIVAHDRKIDYALLELDLPQEHPPLPPALIDILAIPQTSGGIYIIGHPESKVKSIDLCSIIKTEHCTAKAGEHITSHSETLDEAGKERFYQALSGYSFKVLQDRNRKTYFYHGSSGSPVFNAEHQLVAMQQGGYLYPLVSGEKRSVIEYGTHMMAILQSMLCYEIADPLLQEMCRISLEKPELRSVLKSAVEDACRKPKTRTILKSCLKSNPQYHALLESLSNKSCDLGTLLIECNNRTD